MPGDTTKKILDPNNKKQELWDDKFKLFPYLKNAIENWRKTCKKALEYKPNVEWIVQLHQNKQKWDTKKSTENINVIDETSKYLDESNFRLQIGKMQEDWWTIYSDEMLRIWIEYMINHTKEWEYSIIQIWSEVWILLPQKNEKWILTPEKQKIRIEEFIKREFWDRWKCIKVIIWSAQGNYKEVFDELNKWKEWNRRDLIIPDSDPSDSLKKYLKETKKENLSPLPIIKYLAYQATHDQKLMKLFYDTKPESYKTEDWPEHIPWSTDSDFYWIVEVWLRLTEILKWISIQWWAWRQRVYDKIISLIINWNDNIPKNDEFKFGLNIDNYKGLKNLHNIIQELSTETWLNTDFKQLYIELDKKNLNKIKEKIEEKEKLKSKKKNRRENLVYSAIILSILAWWWLYYKSHKARQEKRIKHNTELAKHEDDTRIKYTYPYYDSIHKHIQTEDQRQALHETNYPDPESTKFSDYESEQEQILISAYDLSRFNYINHWMVDDWVEKNEIRDLYSDILEWNYRLNETYLSCEDFMKNYIEILSEHYKIEFQEKYAHLWKYREYIENTMKYYDKDVDLSDHKLEEIKIIDEKTNIEKKISYYMEKDHQIYSLKFVKVYKKGDKEPVILMLARKDYEYPEEFTLEYWKHVAQDLIKNFGKNIWINLQPENN